MPSSSFPTETIVRTLGRADKQISLSIVSCPPIDVDVVLKTHAFDNVMRQVESYLDKFDYAELSSFLLANIPGTSVAAADQANECGRNIRLSLFSVENISQVISFHDSDGKMLAIDKVIKPIAERPRDISWVSIEFRLDASPFLPQEISHDLHPEPFIGVFKFRLPQTPIENDGTPVKRRLFDADPSKAAVSTKLDIKDLPLLDVEGSHDISQVGLEDGSDTLECYTEAVLSLLSEDQMFYLWRSSTARATAEPNIPKTLARALFAGPRPDGTDGTSYSSTFIGSFDFLESQASFDYVFPKPIKLMGNLNAETMESFDKFVIHQQFFV
jgi:hypothetical protein